MTVRIETREIPAKTVKTIIVTVPASEWRTMKIIYWFFGLIFIASIFGSFFGIMVYTATSQYLEMAKSFGFDILKNDNDGIKWSFLLVFLSIPIILIFWLWNRWLESLERKLLKKHGWDSKSPYEVELAYQTFLHD